MGSSLQILRRYAIWNWQHVEHFGSGFEGIPNNVDAAFVWSRNDKIYFFKGSQYFKFDPKKKTPVDESYPRPISNWEGVPDNIDAALQYSNGNTYFFRAGQYFRFDEETLNVVLLGFDLAGKLWTRREWTNEKVEVWMARK